MKSKTKGSKGGSKGKTKGGSKKPSKMSNDKTKGATGKRMTEQPQKNIPRAHRVARFMFTRRTYRLAAFIQLCIVVLLAGGLAALIYTWIHLTDEQKSLDKKFHAIKNLTAKGIDVNANCEYKSDSMRKDWYENWFEKWNQGMCKGGCNRTAYAFRINRVDKEVNGTCYPRIDMVPCHEDNEGYCTPAKNLTNACPGMNKIAMSTTHVTSQSAMYLHSGLITNDSYVIVTLEQLQKDVLDPLRDRYILGSSLVVRCPKCMVTSRCFKLNQGQGPQNTPALYKNNSTVNAVFRQLTTLRAGFPSYARTCDDFEMIVLTDNKEESCPGIDENE